MFASRFSATLERDIEIDRERDREIKRQREADKERERIGANLVTIKFHRLLASANRSYIWQSQGTELICSFFCSYSLYLLLLLLLSHLLSLRSLNEKEITLAIHSSIII